MKYTNLTNDIISLLNSLDNNLKLKFYDKNGNSTLDSKDIKWCYIENPNLVISFTDDNTNSITIWKDNIPLDNNMDKCLKKIRQISTLNGVETNIKLFNDLSRQKIYNILKVEIEKIKNINENVSLVAKEIKQGLNIINSAKKPSDIFISEELLTKNKTQIIDETIDLFLSLKSVKVLDESLIKPLFINQNNIKPHLKKIFLENNNAFNELKNNTKNLINCSSYIKNCYENNNVNTNNRRILNICPCSKIYIIENNNLSDSEKAYNHLISLLPVNPTSSTVIRTIKNHHICETYDIPQADLINMWLESDFSIKKNEKSFIIETFKGNKYVFESRYINAIPTLQKHINQGGSNEDVICHSIINECVKYNELTDLLETYKNNKYVLKNSRFISDILLKTAQNLKTDDLSIFKSDLTECVNYDYELKKIQKESKIKHNALKYLAIEEAKRNSFSELIKNIELFEEFNKLNSGFKPYYKNYKDLSSFIIHNDLKTINPVKLPKRITEANAHSISEKLYENINMVDSEYNSCLNSFFFNTIHTPKSLLCEKLSTLNVLIKHII